MYAQNKTFKIAFFISLLLHGAALMFLKGTIKSPFPESLPSMPVLSVSLTQPLVESPPEISEILEDVQTEPVPEPEAPPVDPVVEVPAAEVPVAEVPVAEVPVAEVPAAEVPAVEAASAPVLQTMEATTEAPPYSGQKLEDLDFSGSVRMPAPAYPSQARKMEWEGDVTVSFVINKKGKVESIIIEESSGYELLDKTVFNTVKKGWRFLRRDDSVRVWKTFSFRLI